MGKQNRLQGAYIQFAGDIVKMGSAFGQTLVNAVFLGNFDNFFEFVQDILVFLYRFSGQYSLIPGIRIKKERFGFVNIQYDMKRCCQKERPIEGLQYSPSRVQPPFFQSGFQVF